MTFPAMVRDEGGALRPPRRSFAVSRDYLILRVCERLGGSVSPRELRAMRPGELAVYLAYANVREAVERGGKGLGTRD